MTKCLVGAVAIPADESVEDQGSSPAYVVFFSNLKSLCEYNIKYYFLTFSNLQLRGAVKRALFASELLFKYC